MSLLFLKGTRNAGVTIAVAAALGCGSAQAAQYYVQPRIEATAESDTNASLNPGSDTDSTEAYLGTLSTVFGVNTPRSQTSITPTLEYREYSDFDDASGLNGWVDWLSSYSSERSSFDFAARYEERSDLNAELSDAQFNQENQNSPTNPDTGRVRIGGSRSLVQVTPSYKYDLTQRFGVGVSAVYTGIDYSPDDDINFIDFDYYKGEVSLIRALSERTDAFFSPYLSKYDARDVNSQTDAVGAAIGFQTRWSETFYAGVSVQFERDEIEQTVPTIYADTINAWGAEFNLRRRAEISDFIIKLGRTVTPSGAGGMYYSDQLQVEYDRDLSQRSSLITAVVLLKDSALSENTAINDRDYAQADLQFEWMLTQTWYVRAGYEFVWQEYDIEAASAKNHRFLLTFGYKGLEPPRR